MARSLRACSCLRAICANYDRLGFLQVRVAFLVEVDRADGAAIRIRFDAMDIGIGANFAPAGLLRHSNSGRQRARFSADLATKCQTETAIDASASSGARL